MRKITSDIPSVTIPSHIATNFSDLILADPLFFESKPVDILLGVNVFFTLLKGDIMKRDENLPFAVSSKLGWIISGTTFFNTSHEPTFSVNNIQLSTHELVEKFWALDSVPEINNNMSDIDKKCEEFFQNTHFRDEAGRYVVKLPFKENPSCLGDSRELALQRFIALERKLIKSPEIYKLYQEFMQEYLNLNHMEIVNNLECPENCYYIPHHNIMKESSTTTKLRVVFNASSKSSSGISLNDILMIGPRIQQELFPILLRFRLFSIVITADIMKMFRQILINEADRDFQRIFWRDSPNKPIVEYRLCTVTYGTSPAPFLATRSVYQLALDEADHFPLASKASLKDFYVDDLLSGSQTVEECKELVNQLIQMMEKGGFVLRKWASNDPTVLECIPTNYRDCSNSMKIDEGTAIKILGINWNPVDDYFHFSVSPIDQKVYFTKRDILSDLARIYDPIGWLAPCIVYIKILIQNLWKISLSWDDSIPDEINRKWTQFREQLPLIEKLKIPRFVLLSDSIHSDIHAFCDASEKAYCAVIYIKSTSSNSEVKVSLLTSKTRVAPLKVQSLPRLELCSAVLLTNLLHAVLKYLEMPIRNIFAWTDSTVVLSWISSESYRWVPFVGNRVEKIQSTLPSAKWRYINGKQNPADCATRGLFPSEFLNCELWFHGPDWLSQPFNDTMEFMIPDPSVLPDCVLKEERKINACISRLVPLPDFILNISSFQKLIRVCAWILRFLNNSRQCTSKVSGCLTSNELHCSVSRIVSLIQRAEFSSELKCLSEGKLLHRDSKLLPLNLFLDREGIIRVGGRLSKHSTLSYDQKYPMLLPKNHEFTRKVIEYYHLINLHSGPQLTLSLIRQKFWFVDGRSVVRQQVRKCLKCLKLNLKSSPQLMGDLPASRIEPVRVFDHVGVDYAGPFFTKCAHKRSVSKFKSYICLFICTTTKAVHLELVSELTTAAFLAALRRFISRRNCPSKIISDNGSNFKGAATHLRELIRLCRSKEVQDFSSMKGIQWSFIPPYTPHFGGLWESAIKSAKRLLSKVCNSALLNFEEMYTLLLQIEACLNSRPLTELSSDPSDISALTPAHFLVGGPIHQFPEPEKPTKTLCLGERWSLIQKLRQHFWDRWSKEYLHQLQPRSKWWKSRPNLNIGDLVLIKTNNAPPLQWTLGRVVEVFPGSDQTVRVLTVKTRDGLLKRSINQVYLLPF